MSRFSRAYAISQGLCELELGPPVVHLPQQVRRRDSERDDATHDQPAAPQKFPSAVEHEFRAHTCHEQHDQVLVEKGDARDGAKRDPPSRVSRSQQACGDRDQRQPRQGVEPRRGQQVPDSEYEIRPRP